jgi:hypothetical protein
MPRNQKLTKLVAARTIKAAMAEPGAVLLLFDDDSRMKIRTAAPVTVSLGGKIKYPTSKHTVAASPDSAVSFGSPRRWALLCEANTAVDDQLRAGNVARILRE